MANKIYSMAYSEVIAILHKMDNIYMEKIPNDILETMEFYRDREHIIDVDTNNLNDMQLLIQTKAILANLYRDYWVDDDKKLKIIKMQQQRKIEEEKQKQEKYDINVFKKNNEIIKKAENVVDTETFEGKNLPYKYNSMYYTFNKILNKIKEKVQKWKSKIKGKGEF